MWFCTIRIHLKVSDVVRENLEWLSFERSRVQLFFCVHLYHSERLWFTLTMLLDRKRLLIVWDWIDSFKSKYTITLSIEEIPGISQRSTQSHILIYHDINMLYLELLSLRSRVSCKHFTILVTFINLLPILVETKSVVRQKCSHPIMV